LQRKHLRGEERNFQEKREWSSSVKTQRRAGKEGGPQKKVQKDFGKPSGAREDNGNYASKAVVKKGDDKGSCLCLASEKKSGIQVRKKTKGRIEGDLHLGLISSRTLEFSKGRSGTQNPLGSGGKKRPRDYQ